MLTLAIHEHNHLEKSKYMCTHTRIYNCCPNNDFQIARGKISTVTRFYSLTFTNKQSRLIQFLYQLSLTQVIFFIRHFFTADFVTFVLYSQCLWRWRVENCAWVVALFRSMKRCSCEWCQTSVHFTQKISCALAFNGWFVFSDWLCACDIWNVWRVALTQSSRLLFLLLLSLVNFALLCYFSEFDLSLCLDFVTSSAVSFLLLASRRSLLFDYLFVTRIVCVSICKVLKNLNRSCASNSV